ncbi:aminoglycoside phosphotransferase family protein [Chryseomicrobium palamuruense]|uniref:Aminoglycoside phosphotransferase family protein n=1 Tax=Chryseomicrobium palamuruense TaxID=682973 RepID=A0ABV8UY23_9BACL
MNFNERIKAAFGERGERWLETLPERIQKITAVEGISSVQPFTNLSYNYVARALRSDESVVLKIGLPGYDFNNEILALQTFPKDAIASLVSANSIEGYYIMESISPGEPLNVKFSDTRTNVRIFVEQWGRLHQTSSLQEKQTTHELPHINVWFEVLMNKTDHVPTNWLDTARAAQQRLNQLNQDTILHGDMHHENILWDETRGFTIIDPKGVIGHAYYDCVQFLFNKNESVEEFAEKVKLLSDEYNFDQQELLDAIKALGMVYLLWAYEDKDPEAKERYNMMKWVMGN